MSQILLNPMPVDQEYAQIIIPEILFTCTLIIARGGGGGAHSSGPGPSAAPVKRT